MRADPVIGDTSKLNIPQDLLSEVNLRAVTRKPDLRIEGLKKPSLLERLVEKLVGGHKR